MLQAIPDIETIRNEMHNRCPGVMGMVLVILRGMSLKQLTTLHDLHCASGGYAAVAAQA
jgi:hypothetical protein